ncbi:hypothetical protein SAMN05421659_11492 [[Clostridium] fimetarium]|uniref:Uncharacterized protein n=1 Tax=[Clostridium] fimetarium TaxID=99656 RepID=A0A1I0REG8_9FIRM|nr:hypothetical protein SAMN05421659_11492 [[Clostridium] fimetarium]
MISIIGILLDNYTKLRYSNNTIKDIFKLDLHEVSIYSEGGSYE